MTSDQRGRLIALLEDGYGARVTALGAIAEYGEAEGGVYRADRQDGAPWVVRVFASGRPLDRVRGDAAVLEYVERHDVPAERLVRTLHASGSSELDGQGVVVTRYVAGTRADRSPTTLLRFGDALGQLHAVPPAQVGDAWLGRRAGALPAEDLAFGRACLSRVAGYVPTEGLATWEALRAALDATDDCDALPSALTHSDFHLDNAVLASNGHPVMIDWVGAGQGPRVAALGVLLYSCAVQAPNDVLESPVAMEPDRMRQVVEAVVDGYCRHLVLTPVELESLPAAVRFRPVVIAARELAASIELGRPATVSGWSARYADADAVAVHAQVAMGHHR